MGILDTVTAAIFQKAGSTPEQQHGFLSGICELINHPEVGGLSGLIDKFKAAGMGHIADGWVSHGPNPPVSADQLKKIFSSEQLRSFAQRLGIDADTAQQHLADMLPPVVDNLTPDGKVPSGGMDTAAELACLKEKLFGS